MPALACGASGASASPNDSGLGSEVGAVAHEGGEDSEADASSPAFPCVDAAPPQSCVAADIHASNYDQTCQTDNDCLLVVEGYACASCSVCAPLSAVNRSAISQYEADVAKIVGPTMGGGGCAPCCGPILLGCCQGGRCHTDTSCSSDAGAE
jgi:hypothetical protein